MEELTRKRTGTAYKIAIEKFSKQFKDIDYIKYIYINSDNKVYAAEWVDKEGVINFNSGYLPDAVKRIKFID